MNKEDVLWAILRAREVEADIEEDRHRVNKLKQARKKIERWGRLREIIPRNRESSVLKARNE